MVADGRGGNTRAVVYDGESGMPRVLRTAGMDYLLAHDQVGTVFKVATPGGREVNRLYYDSFGKPLHQANPDFPLPMGFAGGLYDADTGLYHFGFRDYDPTLGRFIQPDPIGYAGGDVDLYGYCLDDPVNLNDPIGLLQHVPVITGTSGPSTGSLDLYNEQEHQRLELLKSLVHNSSNQNVTNVFEELSGSEMDWAHGLMEDLKAKYPKTFKDFE